MPISTLTSAISSLKAATDIAKLIKDSGFTLEKAEIKLKFADMLNSLADIKISLAELQELLLEKEKIIKELEKRLKLKEKLLFDKSYYWIIEGDKKDGPYCQQCLDNGGKLIRLQGGGGEWECKTCKNWFYDKNYNPSLPEVESGWDPYDR
jgi:hypothetical protein